MKVLIVCVSVSHGNTKKVADVLGEALRARVVEPEQVDPAGLSGYDLVGLGSGVFLRALHSRLRDFAEGLEVAPRGNAFVFATSGFPEARFQPFTRPLASTLERKGFQVAGTFSCRAHDTYLPFKPIGGIRKGRPDAGDLAAAHTFAEGLRDRLGARS